MAKQRPIPITQKQVSDFLKPRPTDSNKGMFGTVTIIGGNNGMIGAALLAGRAALKLGAGRVHIGILADNVPNIDMNHPELMLHSAKEALKSTKPDTIVVGCGLGKNQAAQKLLFDVLRFDVPLVLDADALNLIAQRPDLCGMLNSRNAPSIFTPHPGEAARLLDLRTEDIQRDRIGAITNLARKFNGSIVLKGAGSLCVTSDGKLYINPTGNPGMSSAGMGDVLSGMIGSFVAQGLSTDQSLLLAVFIHGAAGDELSKQHATLGMSATEVTEWARWKLNSIAPN